MYQHPTARHGPAPGSAGQRCPRRLPFLLSWLLSLLAYPGAAVGMAAAVELEQRPLRLAQALPPGALRDALTGCQAPLQRNRVTIAHRGAPLGYPEHTRESYLAAARQGAGAIECDVTFTRDLELVCRHAQCDLHATTNLLTTPLAARCQQPFTPADPDADRPAMARCCSSDLTLAEFRSLCGRFDRVDPTAATVVEYLAPGQPPAGCPTLMSHGDSIALFDELGVDMIPELKAPEVDMPFRDGFTRQAYAGRMLDEYVAAGIDPARVHPQSFDLQDLSYWAEAYPAFAAGAVYLDGRLDGGPGSPQDPASLQPTMAELAARGVRVIAPPLWVLLTLDPAGAIVPSNYARAARAAGLDIATWTLERSGDLAGGGGYYYQSIRAAIDDDSDVYRVLQVLMEEVGVVGVFSDWPATVSRFVNCAPPR